MILLHRLNGEEFALNPDLVERAESTPDTVLVLTDATRLVVEETVAELIELVLEFRAEIMRRAGQVRPYVPGRKGLHLVTGEEG